MHRIHEIFQHIWALNLEGVLKQLERSSILPILKGIIEGVSRPVGRAELENAVARENARISALLRSIAYVESIETTLDEFASQKFSLGIVCTFTIAIQQLRRIREKQVLRLTGNTPISFISRCRVFTDYLFLLEARFDPNKIGYRTEVVTLKSIKDFDLAEELFGTECAVIEKLYAVFRDQRLQEGDESVLKVVAKEKSNASNKAADGKLLVKASVEHDDKKALLRLASTNPVNLFLLYCDTKNLIYDSIIYCRVELSTKLQFVKKEVVEKIRVFHQEIEKTAKILENPESIPIRMSGLRALESPTLMSGHDDDHLSMDTVSAICDIMTHCGTIVKERGAEVKELIRIQELLVEGHTIVGSALPLLMSDQVDNFLDMVRLETVYQQKHKSWASVLDALNIFDKLIKSKIGNCDVSSIYHQVKTLITTNNDLKSGVEKGPALTKLNKMLVRLEPLMEFLAYITSDSLRQDHWQILSKTVFRHHNLGLHITGPGIQGVSYFNSSDPDKRVVSFLRSLPVSFFVDKGMLKDLPAIKEIASCATIENQIEVILNSAEMCMHHVCPVLSSDWLKDPRLHDKIAFDLCRIVNCNELNVMLQYCFKAVSIAEHAAVDMNLVVFDIRIPEIKSVISNMIVFLDDIALIQRQWLSLYHFVKFSQGEIDRETTRLYQLCTEELKKIEIFLNEVFVRYN